MNPALRALTLATLFLALETACVLLALGGWPRLALLPHVAICLASSVLAWRGPAHAPAATLRMATMLMPFLGPVAPLAAAVLLATQAVRPHAQLDAASWHEHLFPNLAADPIDDRVKAIARREPASAAGDDVESFYDVLRWGTLPQREHILSLISRSFRAEFAPVLREALASDDLGLRAQAAAGLSLLETRISARLTALEAPIAAAANGATRDENAISLAQALSEAAHSGLYDELRSFEMRRRVVSLLTPLLDRLHDPALGTMLGRTLIHLGDLEDAISTLERSVAAAAQDGTPADAAYGWLLEALFRRRDYNRINASLNHRRKLADTLIARDGPLAPALGFWSAAA